MTTYQEVIRARQEVVTGINALSASMEKKMLAHREGKTISREAEKMAQQALGALDFSCMKVNDPVEDMERDPYLHVIDAQEGLNALYIIFDAQPPPPDPPRQWPPLPSEGAYENLIFPYIEDQDLHETIKGIISGMSMIKADMRFTYNRAMNISDMVDAVYKPHARAASQGGYITRIYTRKRVGIVKIETKKQEENLYIALCNFNAALDLFAKYHKDVTNRDGPALG